MNRTRALALTALACASVACGGAGANTHTTSAEVAQGATCRAADPVTDAFFALQSATPLGGLSDLGYLAALDDEAAYVRVARRALDDVGTAPARALVAKVDPFLDALSARRAAVSAALGKAEETYEAAESAIDAAAMCRGVDLRDTAKVAPGAKGGDAVAKTNKATAGSAGCEPARRLWQAVRAADLTSAVASSSVAAQVTELHFTGERAEVRARVADALRAHADALRTLHALSSPARGEEDAGARALGALHSDVMAALESATRYCLEHRDGAERALGDDADVRRVTVTVRPKWSGSLSDLPHDDVFGSGFVVKWQASDGHVETRIVTNNHVMDGAFEAEITAGDAPRSSTSAHGSPATLVQADAHEDVAVLRLEPPAETTFSRGIAFRLAPAHEQEQVVAAGFPGVGANPSFQVSRGTVSNARFGANGDDDTMTAYIQHTAPIDPGNSGGPLLDERGALVGMNTLKIVGRENVGLAIPTVRIQAALLRSEHAPAFDPKHAEASCNAALGALGSAHPASAAMSRFGLPLFERTLAAQGSADAAGFREAVSDAPSNPVDVARWRAYGALRAKLEAEGGVRPFEVCSDVKPADGGSFRARFHSRARAHELTFAQEHGAMRVVQID